jgi:haloalkane dehalogenase
MASASEIFELRFDRRSSRGFESPEGAHPPNVIDFRPSAELYPFESRWHDGSAGRMHYVDEGSGQPILLLHGNPTWSFLYRNVIRGLRDRFRCVAVDYLGFGLSDRPSGFGYTPREHAEAVGELVGSLGLTDLIVMGHDWGGPIGLSVASSKADSVAGLVLGNTWFWPAEGSARVFSAVMSSRPLQWAILKRNIFVERIVPGGIDRVLSEEEMDHYRRVQPTPEARIGVAEFPRQIVAASAWLAEVQKGVRDRLATKRTLLTWPMRDVAFTAKRFLPRVRASFEDVEVVELPSAKHYFQEDAPDEVVVAIRSRFG